MTFSPNKVPLGVGRLVSADYRAGAVRVVAASACALTVYAYDEAGRVKRAPQSVSFADDCALIDGGRIERLGRLYYVAD